MGEQVKQLLSRYHRYHNHCSGIPKDLPQVTVTKSSWFDCKLLQTHKG